MDDVRMGEGHDTDNQGSVCKVGTQDPENLDEELKPLVTVWSLRALRYASRSLTTLTPLAAQPGARRALRGPEGATRCTEDNEDRRDEVTTEDA